MTPRCWPLDRNDFRPRCGAAPNGASICPTSRTAPKKGRKVLKRFKPIDLVPRGANGDRLC
jgi:hypothetical protein